MATAGDINLLRTKTRLSPELLSVVERFRLASFIAFGGTLVAGLLIAGLFFEFQRERASVADDKKRLLAAIAQNARKESLFVSLKDRIPLFIKVFNGQKPWGAILDTVSSIAQPPKLATIAIDDQQVILTLKSQSFDEIAGWITAITNLVNQKQVRSPQLVSLQLAKDGSILISLSFTPI